MSWTEVQKPGAQTYTNVNPNGKEQYDQASLSYDDANTFYDGTNPDMWTFVSKPGGVVIKAGMATGLIMPPTYAVSEQRSGWTKISKPT